MRSRRALQHLRRGGAGNAVGLLGMAGFVVWVYVVVVLGGGALIGQTDSPSVPLSVLATTTVALSFARVQATFERGTIKMGLRAARPYDVLRQFSDLATGTAPNELPARMAKLLAQGTGAMWAQVWLNVSGSMSLAATWPSEADVDRTPPRMQSEDTLVTEEGSRTLPVLYAGQLLGVLRLQERPGLPLTLVEERLFAGLAAQAGLVLRGVTLRAELDGRRAELHTRAEEIKASRERLIETQDAERSRLERNLHDGAQQHLVALTVNLRLAQTIGGRSPGRAAVVLAEQATAAHLAIETLSTLSRGIYPRQLAKEGLVAALRSALAGGAIPVTIDTDDCLERPPAHAEAALYFCCMEAVQNATKHSRAEMVSVRVDEESKRWRVTVTDDGTGFDQTTEAATAGVGLANMRDRLDAVGGTVDIASTKTGTMVTAVVPRPDETPSAHGTPVLHQVV